MADKKQNFIDQKLQNLNNDGVDRRGFLQCMAWAGTGLIWTLSGGIPTSQAFTKSGGKGADFSFAQISDSHIGFSKPANPDVTATLQTAISRINALPQQPDFIIHTGDLSQLSKPSEFDTLDQVLKGASPKQIYYVPGEHDMLTDNGEQYLQRYGKGTKGAGWYSFDHKGVHFAGLVNVVNLKAGGLGSLGHEQLEWLESDLKGRSASTPIVIFAHIPLWTIYPDWGWGTDDSEQALSYLKRFGSVTVLNGHIHQVMQKIEGKVSFHTAMSTAFPQPAPGTAPSAGPMKVPADQLQRVLGITDVNYQVSGGSLAIVDSPLGSMGSSAAASGAVVTSSAAAKSSGNPAADVKIDNFAFTPGTITVQPGTQVTWVNRDDIPHTVDSTQGKFKSAALDTDGTFQFRFTEPGEYPYYCRMHPKMTGTIAVKS
ncbi:MAG TPA: metallophosphoesterase [Terriglobales bacterium]|nr:metallophosphoesterase [Terriglobales bacterium]